MENHSIFAEVVIAAIGGVIVVLGLLGELIGEKDWYKNTSHFKKIKQIKKGGEWAVILGVSIEVLVAGYTAFNEQKLRQIAIKNDPLKQPVSQISAVLSLVVNATNVDVHSGISLDTSWLNFESFSLRAKNARWFEHRDNIWARHVAYYTISIKYEFENLPNLVPNDIDNTNISEEMLNQNITVTNTLSALNSVETYVGFLSKNAHVIKGKCIIYINGFRKDIYFNSNSISTNFYEYNPDRSGLYLSTTNFTRNTLP